MYVFMHALCMYEYICMHVCMYVCIYVCMYVFMYVCMYVLMCIYICVCVCVCLYAYMYVFMYVGIYVYMYVFMHICMYLCMHYVCTSIYVCMSGIRSVESHFIIFKLFCKNINNTCNCFLNGYVLDGKCIGGVNNTVKWCAFQI